MTRTTNQQEQAAEYAVVSDEELRVERVTALYQAWRDHAEGAGHNLLTARYRMNSKPTVILCMEEDCEWELVLGA